jgi:hypothetical protein
MGRVWVRVVSEVSSALNSGGGGGPKRWRVVCLKWELGYIHRWLTRGFGV